MSNSIYNQFSTLQERPPLNQFGRNKNCLLAPHVDLPQLPIHVVLHDCLVHVGVIFNDIFAYSTVNSRKITSQVRVT